MPLHREANLEVGFDLWPLASGAKKGAFYAQSLIEHPVYLDVTPSDLQGHIGLSVISAIPLRRYC